MNAINVLPSHIFQDDFEQSTQMARPDMNDTPQDIFAGYECLRHDPAQKRFIQVLDLTRDIILGQMQQGTIPAMDIPSPSIYLAAIASLTAHRLEIKDFDGLPELLRLLHIALESATIDGNVAANLISSLLPLFPTASVDLAIALCQVSVPLCKHANLNDVMVQHLIRGLCLNSLHDDPRLRKAAAQAIYWFPQIHQLCFDFLFEEVKRNPLRALTVIKNLAEGAKHPAWPKHLEQLVEFSSSSNRAVHVKALGIISVALHYLPVETVLALMTRFASERPDAPGEVLYALAELLQSGLTKLVHEDDKSILQSNFPGLLHHLLIFLSIGDEEAEKLIYNTILYGIHAFLAIEDLSFLPPVVQELTGVMTVQFIGIWKPVFDILATLP
jgi:hypothetical protein